MYLKIISHPIGPIIEQGLVGLFSRFSIRSEPHEDHAYYDLWDKQLEQFRPRTQLHLSLINKNRDIFVNMFMPRLAEIPHSKYWSAALFYLLTHHFAHHYDLGQDATINLSSHITKYNKFYSKLRGFNFMLTPPFSAGFVTVEGHLPNLALPISVIRLKDSPSAKQIDTPVAIIGE